MLAGPDTPSIRWGTQFPLPDRPWTPAGKGCQSSGRWLHWADRSSPTRGSSSPARDKPSTQRERTPSRRSDTPYRSAASPSRCTPPARQRSTPLPDKEHTQPTEPPAAYPLQHPPKRKASPVNNRQRLRSTQGLLKPVSSIGSRFLPSSHISRFLRLFFSGRTRRPERPRSGSFNSPCRHPDGRALSREN